MATKAPLTVILGTGNIGDSKADPMARFDTPEEVNALLDVFYERGYRRLDTARTYSPHAPYTCEPRLGAVRAGDRFVIDTKVASTQPGDHKADSVAKGVDASLAALGVGQVNVEYLHMPERSVPLAEPVEAMAQAFAAGKFKQLGISNYTADEVQQMLALCRARGWVPPSVYQGCYNAITRGIEKDLFPVLRAGGLSFYAYSPAAGGFFRQDGKNTSSGGRFDLSFVIGGMYTDMYAKPAMEAAADKARALSAKHGITAHAAALRWVAYHSILSAEHGDAIIVGASSVAQLQSNLDAIEAGPLPQDLEEALSGIYDTLDDKDKASFHM